MYLERVYLTQLKYVIGTELEESLKALLKEKYIKISIFTCLLRMDREKLLESGAYVLKLIWSRWDWSA